MSLIKIDGVSYDVGEVELKRGAEIIYDPLTAGLMMDFSEVDDAVATKYTYSFTVEPRSQNGEQPRESYKSYDEFYFDVTSPKSARLVELPFGQGTVEFGAKIKTAGDALYRSNSGANRWGGLTVTFIPVKPQRYGN